MKIITLLHFYQPHNQQDDILDRIVNECYRPLTEGLLKIPEAKVVVNISGALTRMLKEKGYEDVLNNLIELKKTGKVEFTYSAMYHAFLPLLPLDEIKRQIDLNTQVNKELLGDEIYTPIGLFSPEMAVNEQILKICSEYKIKWFAAPQLAYPHGGPLGNKIYTNEGTDVSVFFRNKRVSALILSAVARGSAQLIEETQDLHDLEDYWFVVMDAETFGHHRIGHEQMLFDILNNEFFKPTLVSEILDTNLPEETVTIRPSTWTNEEQDFWLEDGAVDLTYKNSFILWDDPSNQIHRLQWKLTRYVINIVDTFEPQDNEKWEEARKKLDCSIASDQYWWASAKPWWSLEMVENGAFMLKSVVLGLYGEDYENEHVKKTQSLYQQIMDKAFEWQRTGYIRKMHLENSATYMKKSFKDRAPIEWYNQIVLEFTDEMQKASDNQEFEKAIKWRDALIKLDSGTDIYDVLHVVDELWSARNIPQVKPFLEHDWDELPDFAKKYFRDINSEEDFKNFKKQSKL